MTLDTSDILCNTVSIGVHDSPPRVIRRDAITIIVALAQDEALTLIRDIAAASWSGGAHLVIEADRPTYGGS